jgi:hypothetical protein
MRPVESSAGVTDAAAVELEDDLVEIALEMFPSQAIVDGERPSLQVGEDAMDPRQHKWAAMLPMTWIVSDVGRLDRLAHPPVLMVAP